MRALLAVLVLLSLTSCSAQDAMDGAIGMAAGTGMVHGRVVWVGGAPGHTGGLGSATIFFRPEKGGQALTVVTDSQGAYSLRLAPGSYSVGFAAYRPLPQGERRVTVHRGDVISLDFPVPSPVIYG